MPTPCLLTDQHQLRRALTESRELGKSIAVVLTMGALHEGHLSLVQAAQKECDVTFVTIFVNPSQFGPDEDLAKYPRSTESDLLHLSRLQVAYVYSPLQSEIYPPGFSTFVEPPSVATPLEGESRPGHFRGVATVVLKLLQLIPADVAYFGEKDYQQYLVVRRMVEDLNVPVAIRTCPTVREPDGLAMSSRNRYLSPPERVQALALSRSLIAAQRMRANGQLDVATLTAQLTQVLEEAHITHVDYATIRDAETLESLTTVDRPARALVAAHVGKTRLIDNCALA
jgi:pantoate--beta-alanine ligase